MVGFAVNRAGVETGETSPTKTACGTYRAVEYAVLNIRRRNAIIPA